MIIFQSFTGIITMIGDLMTGEERSTGCIKIMTVEDETGNRVNFIVTPTTYFVNHATMAVGDRVIGFYDANAPIPYIYPPQLQALVMAKVDKIRNIKVDCFDSQLISSDGTLQLNLALSTQIILENGQRFTGNLANRDLIVLYRATTRSIPAQTTPDKIIVMCRNI
ncbi:MAG TPA: hypothetical protein PLZ08_02295 [Bacillota bacterium]|nr:hypothetical protein [Bacillota bacterium]HOL10416.1 hypothetical protein [Bacillota bacterium]HPO96769.1 hypothetical protein [Bacillota bacterium]